jgi:hypothetical protein
MLMPPVFRATISLSPDNLKKVSRTAIMIDMGIIKVRKKGVEYTNIFRTVNKSTL